MYQPRGAGRVPGATRRSPAHPRSRAPLLQPTAALRARRSSVEPNPCNPPSRLPEQNVTWGTFLTLSSHQKNPGGQGGERGSAGAALPRSWRHLPNQRHGGTASAGKALDRFLARWKMGGVATAMQRISYKIKPSWAQGERELSPLPKPVRFILLKKKIKKN